MTNGPEPYEPPGNVLGRRLRSFIYAGRGLAAMLASEANARIHLAATALVVVSGWWLGVTAQDWRWLVAMLALVWLAEALNTAIERLCDLVSPQFHPLVGSAKDVAAGGVLVCAIAAVLVGGLTLWPYL